VLSLDIVSMVPSSSIVVTADGKRLTCSGFSLSEPVHPGNFEFITDYFYGLCRSFTRGNEGAAFMGSTHSEASTPQWATIEDSTEELLTVSSGKGSFNHPSPRQRSTGASFATTITWKENAPTMTRFAPWTVVP
jgi:hypothetical protein